MKKLLDTVTANTTGPMVPIHDGKAFVVGIAASATFGGGTLTIKVYDNSTGAALAIADDKYKFTAVFEPFEITLAPGMAIQAVLTGAASPNIPGVFMYECEV